MVKAIGSRKHQMFRSSKCCTYQKAIKLKASLFCNKQIPLNANNDNGTKLHLILAYVKNTHNCGHIHICIPSI